MKEIDGTTSAGYVGEGTQYAFWVSTANKIKKLSNGSGDTHLWWLRSPSMDNYGVLGCS